MLASLLSASSYLVIQLLVLLVRPELHELLEAHEAPEVLEALEVQRHTSVLNGNCVVELNLTNKRHPCPPTPHPPPFENE